MTVGVSFSIPMIQQQPHLSNTKNSWGPPLISTTGTGTSTSTVTATASSSASSTNKTKKKEGIEKFVGLPYAPFGRSDRLGGGGGGGGGNAHHHHHHHQHQRISGAVADFLNPPPPTTSSSSTSNHQNTNYNNHRDNYRDQQRQRYASQFADHVNDNTNEEDENNNDGMRMINRNAPIDTDTTEFQLVDTSKGTTSSSSGGGGGGMNKKFMNPNIKKRQHIARLRQVNARRLQSAGGAGPGAGGGLDYTMVSGRGGGGGGPGGRGGGPMGGGRGAGGPGGRGGYYNNQNQNRIIDRQPSVAVQETWKLCEELDLSKLTKHLTASTVVPKVSDVVWCGFLDVYQDVYDKISTRNSVPLKQYTNKEFYPVTTTDDPVLEKCAVDGVGQIFITDTILAHLMTCTRSVYPWDIVVTKLSSSTSSDNIYFFDKRNTSTFDYLTVQETAYIQPQVVEDEYGNNINSIERLGLEATMINQNFSQQIVRKTGRKEMELPNPFFDEDDDEDDEEGNVTKKATATPTKEPASIAYRYRKFALESNINVICRTELHGIVKKGTNSNLQQYMTAFALNEYIPPSTTAATSGGGGGAAAGATSISNSNWREKIDNQRGAILANELKNNSFKFAKWTAQSILAGADQMKIGFISKAPTTTSNNAPSKGTTAASSKTATTGTTTNPSEHVILATQFYRPSDFAQQITLQEGQMWCMFRTFIALIDKHSSSTNASSSSTTSKFVIMRHPNKPILHIYQVPPDSFDDEE